MIIIFIISLTVVIYAYIGYPLLLGVLSLLIAKPVHKKEIYPFVSIIISAFNEEKNIQARVNNLQESDYPRDKMEIIVGSDGSTDATYQLIKKLAEETGIRYAVSFQRIGKAAMINKMAKDARGEIFIFADARQRFESDAVRQLVSCFADESVGAASGELIIEDKGTGTGKGLGYYWTYEKAIRKMEGSIGSSVGTTGAIHAIRREIFRYLPEHVILDDIFIPLNALVFKKRVVFVSEARAYDTVSETTEKEFVRKVRTLVGNFQIFSLFPELLNPFHAGWFALQLISHKLMRLLVPYFLLLLLISNIFVLGEGNVFTLAFFLQIILYGTALLGFMLEQAHIKLEGLFRLLYVPYEFCALNFAAVVALLAYKSGRMDARWEK